MWNHNGGYLKLCFGSIFVEGFRKVFIVHRVALSPTVNTRYEAIKNESLRFLCIIVCNGLPPQPFLKLPIPLYKGLYRGRTPKVWTKPSHFVWVALTDCVIHVSFIPFSNENDYTLLKNEEYDSGKWRKSRSPLFTATPLFMLAPFLHSVSS